MRKYIFTSLLVLSFFLFKMDSQSNTEVQNTWQNEWQNIDALLNQRLPESALKKLKDLETITYQHDNAQEMIKIKLYEYRILLEKDPEQTTSILKDFEEFIANLEPSSEKSLMWSMIAELYLTYYQNNSHNINQRTDLADDLPPMIETWAKNHFKTKILRLIDLAWQNQTITKTTDIHDLNNLIQLNDTTLNTLTTLFDFICNKRIEIAGAFNADEIIKETYDSWIAFRKEKNNDLLTIITELKKLEFQNGINFNDNYLDSLDSLENSYTHTSAIVEIWTKKVLYYLDHPVIENNKVKAYQLATKAIETYPNYERINQLKNIKVQIEKGKIVLKNNPIAKPNNPLSLEFETTNISAITVELYKINTTAKDFVQQQLNKHIAKAFEQWDKTLINTTNLPIAKSENFDAVKTKHLIQTPTYGIYQVVAYPTDKKNNYENPNAVQSYFVSTDFSYIKRSIASNKSAYYVVDRMTGKGIKEVHIQAYRQVWRNSKYVLEPIDNATTNAKGYAELSKENAYNNEIIFLEKGEDIFFSTNSYSSYFQENNIEKPKQTNISLFTDRSIYRPGQSLYFKAIAYEADAKTQKVLSNYSMQIDLLDNNWQVIKTIQLNTNEFGSVSGEFILPNTGLNGQYQIRANNRFTTTFLVEAYKRPSFEVMLEQPKEEISFGEKVIIDGNAKAFAGYDLPNIELRYTIKRYVHPFWRWIMPVKDGDIVAAGNTQTDTKGKFTICYIPQKVKMGLQTGSYSQNYQYVVTVEATDTKGETQSGSTSFAVGERSLFIQTDLAEIIEKNAVQNLEISLATITGNNIHKTVQYQIFSLQEEDIDFDNQIDIEEYKANQLIEEAWHNTENGKLLLNFNKYKNGRYKLIINTEDQQGRAVSHEQLFIIYDKNSKHPPIQTYSWLQSHNTELEVGEKAQIQFGTSTKNTHVLMEVMHGNKVISSKWIKFNNQIRRFNILLKNEYRTGITVNFTYIKNEKLIQRTVYIKEKIQEKKLSPSLEIFRDKLLPGEEVVWTIRIPELPQLNQQAELMAGMYDASLDKINPHAWYFNPTIRQAFPYGTNWTSEGKNQNYDEQTFMGALLKTKEFNHPYFDWHGLNINMGQYHYLRNTMAYGMGNMLQSKAMAIAPDTDITNSEENLLLEESTVETYAPNTIEPPTIRTNFNETAFFYPHLINDTTGKYQIQFTMPESLTRWNLKLLAHTKDLYFGQTEAEVLTQQDFMVQLHMPRFVRQSDKIILNANLINLSDEDLTANVSLTLIDPKTDKIVLSEKLLSQNISISKDEGPKAIAWEINGFEDYDLLICKIIAETDKFSDGEQHYLLILPDKVLITESFPINITDNQEQQFDFNAINQLADKVETQSLSFEFTANPIWYALQAMPALAEAPSDNAVDIFVAWYVNTLAGKIIEDNPTIQRVFQAIQISDSENWQSALLKNQELKDILIAETPWLAAAQNETERMQRIALLFELNNQQQKRSVYWEKLKSLQLSNGAFAWFDGMRENRQITQFIADGLLKIRAFTTDPSTISNINNMLEQAIQYLDGELNRDYLLLKKQVKDSDPKVTPLQIQYLAIRAQIKEFAMQEDCKIAYEYYIAKLEQQHTHMSIYDKALSGVALHYAGKHKAVNLIVQSLQENALTSDILGMYWAQNKAGYAWNERPIAVQTQIMELFNLVGNQSSAIAAMKTWLIRQKQTQSWDSPIASIHAIQALVGIADNALDDNAVYTINMGSKQISTNQGVTGVGYIKEAIDITDLKEGIQISRTDASNEEVKPTIAWGAVYWRYYQDIDKITAKGDFLQVDKQLYLEQIVNNTKTLVLLEGQKVKIGDKIISRMIVVSDRNLDYVAMTDKRSAALEPVQQLSACHWRENLVYYRTVKDASTQYFFNHLPKGTYVFEDAYYVSAAGDFSGGTANIQCLYAPEFVGHSQSSRIVINP